jgi:hypothetical protein
MTETESNVAKAEVQPIAAQDEAAASDRMSRIEEHPAWPSLARVPETITALIPLRQFTVRTLLLLAKGQTIESNLATTEDIPIKIGSVQIAWGEFEVADHTMALRINRIA